MFSSNQSTLRQSGSRIPLVDIPLVCSAGTLLLRLQFITGSKQSKAWHSGFEEHISIEMTNTS